MGHRFGAALGQVNQNVHILAKIRLGPNQDDWGGAVPGADLRDPLGRNVLEGDGVGQAEAQDEDVDVGITQRTKMSKLLLSHQTKRELRGKRSGEGNPGVVWKIYLSCRVYQLDASGNTVHMDQTWKSRKEMTFNWSPSQAFGSC